MEINFNGKKILGDFTFLREKEIGKDKDFIIKVPTSIVNIQGNCKVEFMQIRDVKSILIRMGQDNISSSLHFMHDSDFSSVFLTVDLIFNSLEFEYDKEKNITEIKFF